MKPRNISSFFNNEYLEYAKYVVEERAIPSVIDGLKPTARKIIHAAIKSKFGKRESVFNLVGETYKRSQYHHGDTGLSSGIIGLGQKFRNNLAPFNIIGSGGDLRNYETASPRYLKVEATEFLELYKKDLPILTHRVDGEQEIEPEYYLPIIPTVLTKRHSGIGLGFSFNLDISYNPVEVAKSVGSYLTTGKIPKNISPYVDQYQGEFKIIGDRILSVGKYNIRDETITIKELPHNITYQFFEEKMAYFLETGQIIDWENLGDKDNPTHYKIVIQKEKMDKYLSKDPYLTKFMLNSWVTRPTFNLLDENRNIINFQTIQEIIKYFADFRLKKYTDSKKYQLKKLQDEIKYKDDIARFIDLYHQGKIQLKDTPLEKVKSKLDQCSIGYHVLDIKIQRLTREQMEKLLMEIQELKDSCNTLKETHERTLYLNDLKMFIEKYKDEYKQQKTILVKQG